MKVVLITGVSSGIGLANAKRFLEKTDFKVYGISHLPFQHEGICHFQADIRNYQKINEIVDQIIVKEGRIDYLINCAGMGISGSVENTPDEALRYMYDVNFFGMNNLVQKVIPIMRQNGFGRIANMSSVAAVLPISFQTYYSAVKASINLYSEGLNIELKPFKIRVITFMPGDVKTAFTANRKKNKLDDASYGKRIEKSVSMMEHDEQNGMTVEYVAKVMVKNLLKKRPPIRKTIGFKYKFFLFLYRILPISFVNYVLGKLYG